MKKITIAIDGFFFMREKYNGQGFGPRNRLYLH